MIAFLRRDLKWGRVEVLTNNEGPKGIPKVKRDLLNASTLMDFSLVMKEHKILKF